MNTRIAIVGGGITGLAAAYRLRRLLPRWRITLLEQDNRLGGKIWTEPVDGFTLEAGADSFLSRKPQAIGLCEELGLAERLIGRNLESGQTLVWRHGALHRLPEGLSGMIPADIDALLQSELLSDDGRQRAVEETRVPAAVPDGDESLASFITRRFGHEAYENIIEPLMSGVYAGRGELLSLAATYPQLRHLELSHGSLVRGLWSQPNGQNPAYAPFVSLAGGMGELVATLAGQLSGAELRLNCRVSALRRAGRHFELDLVGPNGATETISAALLILTTPADVTARLLAPLHRQLAGELAGIPYASTAIVSLAYNQAAIPRPLSGFGYLVPAIERQPVLACTWTSSKWAGRAPAGKALLRLYIGRYGEPDATALNDERLLALATAELRRTLGITASPLLSRIHRWPRAIPQYLLGHLDRVARIQYHVERAPGLFLAGAYLRGVGISDCIRSGQEAADEALARAAGA
jgi:oxygen-dependent protoporphyrinogen oxidase